MVVWEKIRLAGCLILSLSCQDDRSNVPEQKSSPLSHKLDSIGQSFIDSGQILGLSVTIMQGSDTLYNNGFGYTDAKRTQPVTNETRFLLANNGRSRRTVLKQLVAPPEFAH